MARWSLWPRAVGVAVISWYLKQIRKDRVVPPSQSHRLEHHVGTSRRPADPHPGRDTCLFGAASEGPRGSSARPHDRANLAGGDSGSSSRCRSAHTRCLPVLFRLWRGQGTASPVQLARELISILAQVFPNRLVHAVGDAAYHGKALLVPATTITARRPANAALYALAPPRTGKRCSRWSRNAATSGASRYSICSSEGDTSVRSAVPSAIAGVLIAARGPDAEALSGLASSAGHLLGSPL